MKGVLSAAAVLVLVAGAARAEGPNAVEMRSGIARPIMTGQFGRDTGSDRVPLFSRATTHAGADPILGDTGSEATPLRQSIRQSALASK